MLYDPKWEVETKVDPFSLDALIAWLETMPANARYCYTSNGQCMIAQYLTSLGYTSVHVGGFGKWYAAYKCGFLPEFARIANTPEPGDQTFGGALERARALAASIKSGAKA